MIKGKPVIAETIHINHPDASYGIFCFNDQGDLFVNSDYGFFGFAWRSYGDNFREFLSRTNPDYMAGKFEVNHCGVTGKRKMPEFLKEKLILLCELFIKTLKENPAPVQTQELTTRLYNLVNAVDCRGVDPPGSYDVLDMYMNEARETLKKVIQ